MNCKSEEEIFEYLNDRVEGDTDELFLGHLEKCSHCSKIYEELIHMNNMMEGIGDSTTLHFNKEPEQIRDGLKLGNYKLISPISSGGMGRVWKAKDTVLDRIVAIKVLREDVSSDEFSQRFLVEAKIIAQLNHPNIIQIYGAEQWNENLCIVMEHIDGITLKEYKKQNDVFFTLQKFKEILLGIHSAHCEGIIHRDIKPTNIMLDKKSTIKVLDFGLAKSKSIESDLTQAGGVFGTMAYLAPEVAKGQKFTVQSDIFSLGVVLYELITGSNPFNTKDVLSTLEKIKKEKIPIMDTKKFKYPPAINGLISKMCHADLSKRYQSIQDIIKDLDSIESPQKTTPQNQDRTVLPGANNIKESHDGASRVSADKASVVLKQAKEIQDRRENSLSHTELLEVADEMNISSDDVKGALDKQKEIEKKNRLAKIIVMIALFIGGVIVIQWYMNRPTSANSQQSKLEDEVDRLQKFRSFKGQSFTLAVLPFDNQTSNPKYKGFAASCAEALILPLAGKSNLSLIERMQLDKVMSEINLSQSKYIDPAYAIEIGKMLNTDLVIMGALQQQSNEARILARVVEVSTGTVVYSERVHGQFDDLFDLQDKLANSLADKF